VKSTQKQKEGKERKSNKRERS